MEDEHWGGGGGVCYGLNFDICVLHYESKYSNVPEIQFYKRIRRIYPGP